MNFNEIPLWCGLFMSLLYLVIMPLENKYVQLDFCCETDYS
jgi:hypothetical protein